MQTDGDRIQAKAGTHTPIHRYDMYVSTKWDTTTQLVTHDTYTHFLSVCIHIPVISLFSWPSIHDGATKLTADKKEKGKKIVESGRRRHSAGRPTRPQTQPCGGRRPMQPPFARKVLKSFLLWQTQKEATKINPVVNRSVRFPGHASLG